MLTGRIGAGGMGTVYFARHSETGAPAAVKVMSDALADQPEFRARFAREIEVLRRVEGPFVAAVLDGDAWAELPWVATEYVPGPDLARLIEDHGALDAQSWEGLATGLLSALSRLHAEGVVHRDLKPANVLLAPDGPRLIDFGVAQLADATALTATGAALGTLGWLAPEQIAGSTATSLTDVFSAGAVLAFAATGRPPFGHGTPAATVHAVMHDAPDLSGVPRETQILLQGLLEKDPTVRWTATRAASYLAGGSEPTTVDDHATRMWRDGQLTRLLSVDATQLLDGQLPPPAPDVVAPTSRKGWRKWAIGAATATALVASGLLGASFLTESDESGVPSATGDEATAATSDAQDPPASATEAESEAPPTQPSAVLSSITDSIPVGEATLSDVAVTPDGSFAYAPDGTLSDEPGQVFVFDLNTNEVIDTISIDGDPQGIAISPDGTQAYVSIASGLDGPGELAFVDVRSNTVTDTTPVGEYPRAISVSPDGATIYVATVEGVSVVEVDSGDSRVVDLDGVVWDVAVSPDGKRVYATTSRLVDDEPASYSLAVVESAGNTWTDTVPLADSPGALAVSPDGSRVYATAEAAGDDEYGGLVQVINTINNTVMDSIVVGGSLRGMAISPDGNYLYVTKSLAEFEGGGSMVETIDVSSRAVVESLPTDFAPVIATSPDGSTGYVAGGELFILGQADSATGTSPNSST